MESFIAFLVSLDVKLMYFFNMTLSNPVFNWIMPIFNDDKGWQIPLGVLFILMMIFGNKKMRIIGAGAVLMLIFTDMIAAKLIKPYIGRIRPCNVLSGLNVWHNKAWIVTPEQITEVYKRSFSFPSNHAANSGGQGLWWSWAFPKFRVYILTLALMIGFSRVYTGVHYPFDLVGGWILGAIGFYLISRLYLRFFDRSNYKL